MVVVEENIYIHMPQFSLVVLFRGSFSGCMSLVFLV